MKKRNVLIIALVALIGIAFIFNACKPKDDTVKPVITLKKDANNNVDMVIVFKATFTDPGYTATDDVDGDISSSVTVTGGPVNNLSAGVFSLVHNVKDAAGNAADAVTRKVTVDAAAFLAGSYNVVDVANNATTNYTDNVVASTDTKNKIYFQKFGNYSGAVVYATASGTNLTIPEQTVTCGLPPNNIAHKFSGTGTFSNSSGINVTYSDQSTLGTFTGCTGTYTKL
jgi:hypothetical protein